LENYIVGSISLAVALAAVGVSTWQVRQTARSAARSHALPVIAEVFREFRSPEFRASVGYLLSSTPVARGDEGFASLPEEWCEKAYVVVYFFDYLGVLVSSGIINEELVIGTMGTRLVQTWIAIKPFIMMERAYRISSYPPGTPPGFLAYYEHLVKRVEELGGGGAAIRIQQRAGLHRIDEP
jgi:hypothetical protein